MYILIGQALDESTRAAALDDQALLDQLVHGLLNGNAADTVLFTHFALKSQLLTGLINPGLYLRAQIIGYFLIFYHNTHSL